MITLSQTDDSLRCDRCGNIETPPYADGDTCCMCGGTFHHEPGGTGQRGRGVRNRHPGICYRCGKPVAAGDGHFERHKGGWRVQHADCAIEARKPHRMESACTCGGKETRSENVAPRENAAVRWSLHFPADAGAALRYARRPTMSEMT